MAKRELITPDPDKSQFSLKQIGIATVAVAVIFSLPIDLPLQILYSCMAGWWIISWDWAAARLSKAHKLTNDGQHEAAREICDGLIEQFPKKPTAYVYRGMALMHCDLTAAERDFDQALMLNPDYGYVWIGKGLIRQQQGKTSEAVNCFKTAALDPKSMPYAHFKLAELSYLDGELADARIHAEYLATHLAWIGHYHSLRGAIAYESGEFSKAEQLFELAFDAQRAPDLLTNLVLVAFKKGRYEWAVDKATQLVDSNPQLFYALIAKSWILSTCPEPKLRDGKEAVELALRSIALDNNWSSQATLAAAYAEVGDFDNAMQLISKALAHCPKLKRRLYIKMRDSICRHEPFEDDGTCYFSFQPTSDEKK